MIRYLSRQGGVDRPPLPAKVPNHPCSSLWRLLSDLADFPVRKPAGYYDRPHPHITYWLCKGFFDPLAKQSKITLDAARFRSQNRAKQQNGFKTPIVFLDRGRKSIAKPVDIVRGVDPCVFRIFPDFQTPSRPKQSRKTVFPKDLSYNAT